MKRKLISFCVAMAIVGSIAPSAYAASSDTSNTSSNSTEASGTTDNSIKISLGNIKDIITEYNSQAKIYDNNRGNVKLTYDDAKDKRDAAESTYNTASDEYNQELAKYNQDQVNNAKPTTTAVDNAKAALDNAETNLDSARTSLDKADITYNKSLQSLIQTAQKDYITYALNDLPGKEYNTANLDLLKKKADIAKIQYDNGFLSKDDYTTAQLKYTTALNTSNSTSGAEENDKDKLYYDLGISSGQNVTFETDLDQDFKAVESINYNDDLAQMFNNNLTLQADDISVDEAKDAKDNEADSNTDNQNEIIDNKLENASLQLTSDKNTAEKDFKAKYDALMNSYAVMKNSGSILDQKKSQYNVKQIQYQYGFASQEDVNQANVDLLQESQSYQGDKSKFYEDYLSYIQAKEGY